MCKKSPGMKNSCVLNDFHIQETFLFSVRVLVRNSKIVRLFCANKFETFCERYCDNICETFLVRVAKWSW
jgi:hypothetical protein